MSESTPAFEQWCIVDLFGHQRVAGRVSEQVVAGTGFLRIDIPREDGGFVTKLQNPKSVYAISPCSEEVAREAAKRIGGVDPIRPMEFRQLPGAREDDDEGDEGQF